MLDNDYAHNFNLEKDIQSIFDNKFIPTELFNFKELQDFLTSKVVREKRTHTPVDFVTDEELKKLNEQGIHDLSSYIPTPAHIRDLINFAIDTHRKLTLKYPNDEYLKSLVKEENINMMLSYNWYERYGIKYGQ